MNGYLVDKYRKFKLITCCWYASAVIGFSAFAAVLQLGSKTAFIIVAAFYGPCQMGLTPVTLNFGGELVYPEAESTSAALISAIPDAWGFIVIEIVQAILNGFENVSI